LKLLLIKCICDVFDDVHNSMRMIGIKTRHKYMYVIIIKMLICCL